ncbi:hypothetical protein ACFL59_00715 [Planctomycetota bacterium]
MIQVQPGGSSVGVVRAASRAPAAPQQGRARHDGGRIAALCNRRSGEVQERRSACKPHGYFRRAALSPIPHGASLRSALLVVAVVAVTLLSGCKEDIVYGVSQAEALEIVVKLGQHGIPATTQPEKSDKEPRFTIQVDGQSVLEAKELLLRQQLPKAQPAGLRTLFETQSMIPTSAEEKVRILIGLQGDLSATLETIDNVVDAQVHIVMPEANPLQSDSDRTDARAAVLMKYRAPPLTEDEEKRLRQRWKQKEKLLLSLREDLLKLQGLINNELSDVLKEDAKLIREMGDFLDDHAEMKDLPLKSILELKRNHTERFAAIQKIQNLPKIKDLGQVLDAVDRDETMVLPFQAASVRKIVSSSIPRLRENNVAVEFTEVVERQRAPVRALPTGIKKEYFIGVAGAAALLALLLMGAGVYLVSLKRKLAAAEQPEG